MIKVAIDGLSLSHFDELVIIFTYSFILFCDLIDLYLFSRHHNVLIVLIVGDVIVLEIKEVEVVFEIIENSSRDEMAILVGHVVLIVPEESLVVQMVFLFFQYLLTLC